MLNPRETAMTSPSRKQALSLLISSRDAESLQHLQALCQEMPELQVTTRLVTNGHTDPLYGLERMPDLLLLRVSHLWREELAALLQRPAHERPPLLVCGPLEEREGMRLAMQAGARDFLPEPVEPGDLLQALQRMIDEARPVGSAGAGRLVALINAKGGSGATMLACNLAQQLSTRGGSVLLVDLDLQFGSVAHYLDVLVQHSHVEVLKQVHELDSVALRGFCTHYSPSLHVLGGRADELFLPQDVQVEQLEVLLRLARETYDWVVVDLPRQIDHLSGTVLEQADQVYVLLQQSLSHIKDGSRLVRILRDELGVQGNRLQVVVNRYDKSAPITPRDIEEALRCSAPLKLPNDFAVVNESQNAGVPLETHAPRAPITAAVRELSLELLGHRDDGEKGLLKRAFGRFFKGVSHA
ncbi:hypothetical protein E0E54_14415 [Azotobacter chroococcum]|uniref:AAA family ATPase n=1 Tax=Azotobacter chroococcum TaxID=353 RepID=UPI00103C85C0|nr:AAA family ATPase [Azotobacter chroococcum]TBW34358.1 hypothetical protein E0E54_14415 [Azotobacter chroococcum]